MIGFTDPLRTGAEAMLMQADPSRHSGYLPIMKSLVSRNILVSLACLLVSLAMGCNEGRVEQPTSKATAEQEQGKAAPEKGNT
ncbi:MAG: hypothetical protein ACREJU_03640, partial [Nitrospiraceae bacterium]